MNECTGFIDSIVMNITSNAIWAFLGGGFVYSIYCRLRLQTIIKKMLLKQRNDLTDLQNTYINIVKLKYRKIEDYPDGLNFIFPAFIDADEICHYGQFSKWALLKGTKDSLKVLVYVLKRYETKRDQITGTPSQEQAYALLHLGMNIYYQMITISKDWHDHTMIKVESDQFNSILAEYFGILRDDKEIWSFLKNDKNFIKNIMLAKDLKAS